MSNEVSFEDFKKVDIRIGKIVSAERVEGSKKLLKLTVDFGDGQRQIIAGLGTCYQPEQLVDKQFPFAYNLEARVINGLESQGMMLCADDSGPVLLHPDKEVKPGSVII